MLKPIRLTLSGRADIFEPSKEPDGREIIMKYLLTGISLVFFLLVTAEISADKLYTWTDEKGNLHITQQPPPANARHMDVMTYRPQTGAQIQKIEKDARREDVQDKAVRQKDTLQETAKSDAKTEQADDEDVYIGREGKMIRRAEESQEIRQQRQDRRREHRSHRR
jgi:hypothetical protein